jgi:hypothetical protein
MRRLWLVSLIVAGLHGRPAGAAPPGDLAAPAIAGHIAPKHEDASATPGVTPGVTGVATADDSPWLDQGGGHLPARATKPTGDAHPKLAAGIVAGIYANFGLWTYYAWYRHQSQLPQYKFGGDGWIGDTTYAGGADKFGHAWSTLAMSRLTTELLVRVGGFDRLRSSLVATGMTELMFTLIEVKDGYFYEFSFSDLTGDLVGGALALALSNFPRLDELLDYRIEYRPTRTYWNRLVNQSDVDFAEDYTGQTYMLALHLGAIHALRDQPWGGWTRFVDVYGSFGSRGYRPLPAAGDAVPPHLQELSFGISLNAQGLVDWLLDGRGSPTVRAAAHGVFEMINLPFTSVPLRQHVHQGPAVVDGE